jgi:hypothetical protein
LRARLAEREKGAGAEEQLQRTLRQAKRMAEEKTDALIIMPTDGKTPTELVQMVLSQVGWLR